MLEAIPASILSNDYRLEDDGKLVGAIETSLWRETAQLELEDGTYNLHRATVTSGEFVAERQGKIFARAAKTSYWRHDFDVELGNRRLTLRATRWKRAYGVFDSDKQIGTVAPTTLIGRRAIIDLPASWSVLDRAFLLWLCLIMWRRQSA
jgi:hypothetical protein